MIFFIPKEKGKSFLGLNNSVKNVCFQAIKKGVGAKNVSKLIYTPFFLLEDSWEKNEIYSNQQKIEKRPL